MTIEQAKWNAMKLLGTKADVRERAIGRSVVREVGVVVNGVFVIKGSCRTWSEALAFAQI
jgi:hypothetical protein